MPDYNSMQANLGLLPNVGQPTMMTPIKSPAQVAAELSAQATANLQYASSIGPQVARNMPQLMSFGQQFQQQFQSAQQMQSFNPYMANMMSSAGGYGGGQMNLPSPIMMTPASSGVFRPPMPTMGMQAIPPMPVMPLIQTPFTPQLPRPQFQTAWEQELQQRDYRADSIYSYAIQAPRMGGNMAGYGMGAMAGAMMGGRMGRPIIGAAMGMIGAGMSGLAGGMGDLAMMPFRPSMETHMMGASIQRASQDWVVGGSQLHQLGRGLTRSASMDLSRGIMDMQEDRTFRQQTGGMFSRQDLSNILQTGGRAGLMDFTQNTDQIKEQLRRTAISLKKFMELTNDPDVSGLIRKMADLQRLGYGPGDMENAAYSMRRFSRGAGTSIDGIMQMGGAGAMTYQGMGLSAASGMQYGMFSAMAARQSIASGVYTPAQAAMLGGQSGIAQRNMQAQAALMSMPLVGASMASFQGGSWGVDYGQVAQRMSGRGGAAGFVTGAAQNLSRAVYGGGGVGALAMYPLQAGMMQDEISRAMSPEQQTAMRFQSALATGKSLGLTGAGAFAAGARMMYGDEVATQMLKEASSPQYWKSLKDNVRRQQNELAIQQFQDIKDNAPGLWGNIKEAVGGAGRSLKNTVGAPFSEMGRMAGRFFKNWGDSNRLEDAIENGQYYYAENEFSGLTKKQTDVLRSKNRVFGSMARMGYRGTGSYRNVTKDVQLLEREAGGESLGSRTWTEAGLDAASTAAGWATPLGLTGFGYDQMQSIMGFGLEQTLTPTQLAGAKAGAAAIRKREGAVFDTSDTSFTGKKGFKAAEDLGGALGISRDTMILRMQAAGGAVAKKAGEGQHWYKADEFVGTKDTRAAFRAQLTDEERKRFDTLDPDTQMKMLRGVMSYGKKGATAEQAAGLSEAEAMWNERKSAWESAKDDIGKYQKSLDVAYTGMGISASGDREKFAEWLKGTTASEQFAVGMNVRGSKGGKDIEQLRALVAKEMGPKAKKKDIDARVTTLLDQGVEGVSTDVRKMLGTARESLGDEGFQRALTLAGGSMLGGQQATGMAAMQDLVGDMFSGGKVQVGNVTEAKLAKLAKTNPELARAFSSYKKAFKEGDTKALGKAGESVLNQMIEGGLGKGGQAEALTAPTGEQAQQLAASADSLDKVAASMEKAFKNFTETSTKNFAEGAKALAEHFNKATTEPIGE